MLSNDSKGIQSFILHRLIQIYDDILIHDPETRELGIKPQEIFKELKRQTLPRRPPAAGRIRQRPDLASGPPGRDHLYPRVNGRNLVQPLGHRGGAGEED